MQNDKLVYIFDPYCCWSYGNSKNLYEIFHSYQDRIDFKVYPAGLWYGHKKVRITPRFAESLEYRAVRISEITGVLFSGKFYSLLTGKSMTIDSEKPSRALITINRYWPELSVDYAIILQKTFFWEALDLSADNTYEEIAENLGLPAGEFMHLFRSPEIRESVPRTFRQAEAYSTDCPSLFYVNRLGKVHPVSRGYETMETIRKNLEGLFR